MINRLVDRNDEGEHDKRKERRRAHGLCGHHALLGGSGGRTFSYVPMLGGSVLGAVGKQALVRRLGTNHKKRKRQGDDEHDQTEDQIPHAPALDTRRDQRRTERVKDDAADTGKRHAEAHEETDPLLAPRVDERGDGEIDERRRTDTKRYARDIEHPDSGEARHGDKRDAIEGNGSREHSTRVESAHKLARNRQHEHHRQVEDREIHGERCTGDAKILAHRGEEDTGTAQHERARDAGDHDTGSHDQVCIVKPAAAGGGLSPRSRSCSQ